MLAEGLQGVHHGVGEGLVLGAHLHGPLGLGQGRVRVAHGPRGVGSERVHRRPGRALGHRLGPLLQRGEAHPVLPRSHQRPIELLPRTLIPRVAVDHRAPALNRPAQVARRRPGARDLGPPSRPLLGRGPLGQGLEHLQGERWLIRRAVEGQQPQPERLLVRREREGPRQRLGLGHCVARVVAVQVGQAQEHVALRLRVGLGLGALGEHLGEGLPALHPAQHEVEPREGVGVAGVGVHHFGVGVDGRLRIVQVLQRHLRDLTQPRKALIGRAMLRPNGLREGLPQPVPVAPRAEVVLDEGKGLQVGRVDGEHLAQGLQHGRAVALLPVEGGEVFQIDHALRRVGLCRERLQQRRELVRPTRVAVEPREGAGEGRVVAEQGLEARDGVVGLPVGDVLLGQGAPDDGCVRARRVGGHEGNLPHRELFETPLGAVGLVKDGVGRLVACKRVEGRLREGDAVIAPDALGEGAQQPRRARAVVGLGLGALGAGEVRARQLAEQLPVVGALPEELFQVGNLRRGVAELRVNLRALPQEHGPHEGVGGLRELTLQELRGRPHVAELEVDGPRGFDGAQLGRVELVGAAVVADGLVGAAYVFRPELSRAEEEVGCRTRVGATSRGLLHQRRELLKLTPPSVMIPQEIKGFGVVRVMTQPLVVGVDRRLHPCVRDANTSHPSPGTD